MKKKLIYILSIVIIFIVVLYFAIGFYIANSILKIDHTCGLHEGSKPNTWSTFIDHHEYSNLSRSNLRKNFPFENYSELVFP